MAEDNIEIPEEKNESAEKAAGSIKEKDYIKTIINKMKSLTYVQPGEVPNIDLYMDQVTTFMDEYLESSKRYSDDKLLTKTMINNYTKNDLLPSPDKKKYSKDHMYMLLFIYYLKNILSINDTKSILKPLTDMFFKKAGTIDLQDIYAEIFRVEEEQSYALTRDMVRKYNKSMESFTHIENDEERDILQAFSFISMLCFDVYVKKQMIGKIIDDYFISDDEKQDSKEKEKAEKKEKKEKAEREKAEKEKAEKEKKEKAEKEKAEKEKTEKEKKEKAEKEKKEKAEKEKKEKAEKEKKEKAEKEKKEKAEKEKAEKEKAEKEKTEKEKKEKAEKEKKEQEQSGKEE